MKSRASAQLILYLDPEDNEIKAEIAGANGSRKKIVIDEKDLPPTLIDELVALDVWLRDQEHRAEELREAHKLAHKPTTQTVLLQNPISQDIDDIVERDVSCCP